MRVPIDHTSGATSAATGAAMSLASTWTSLTSDPTLRVVIVSTLAGFVGVILRMVATILYTLARRGIVRLAPSLARDIPMQPDPPAQPVHSQEPKP